jgi:uncharacterized RDD family membrane protein YckC
MNEEIARLLERGELHLASIQKRAIAFLIDELLLSALLMIILWEGFSSAGTLEAMVALTNAYVLEYIGMKILYQTVFVMLYGATIGKIVMKIRVVEIATLANPSFMPAFNRAVFRIISEMIFYLGFLWAMLDPARQAWHDKTARTLVVDA